MTDDATSSTSTPRDRNREVAEAFSQHRFEEAYDCLSDDVRWVLPGQDTITGRQAVIDACTTTLTAMAGLAETSFTRFVSVADGRTAAVDAVGRYVAGDGAVSVVSSADVYEFDERGQVETITSYAVELDDRRSE